MSRLDAAALLPPLLASRATINLNDAPDLPLASANITNDARLRCRKYKRNIRSTRNDAHAVGGMRAA
jgi:hypothetical protein